MQHGLVLLLRQLCDSDLDEPPGDGVAVVLVVAGLVALGDGLQPAGADEDVAVGGDGQEGHADQDGVQVPQVLEHVVLPVGRADVHLRGTAATEADLTRN